MCKLRSDNSGYIVVETIGAFIPFVLLIMSILSLVNIITVQARMHYALTQAANTISMYSYTFEALGMADEIAAINGKAGEISGRANAIKDDINAVLDGLSSLSDLSGAADSAGNAVHNAYEWGEEAISDPKEMIKLFANYGIEELKNMVFEQIARPLIGRYLANGNASGDEYLTAAGVVNKRSGAAGLNALEFYSVGNLGRGNSELLNADGNIKLVVEYETLYTFGVLRLPFQPTLKITQTVVTKAWLNGSGKGYPK